MGVFPVGKRDSELRLGARCATWVATALALLVGPPGVAQPAPPSNYFLPTVYAVHKKFASGAADPIFDSMVRFVGTDGLYQTQDGRQIFLSECGGGGSLPFKVQWDEADLINAASSLPTGQAEVAIKELKNIQGLSKANSANAQFGAWGLYSNDEQLLELIKQFALSQFETQHGGSVTFHHLKEAQLPLVIIFLPSKGRLSGERTPSIFSGRTPYSPPWLRGPAAKPGAPNSFIPTAAGLFDTNVKAWTNWPIPSDGGTYGSATPYIVMALTSVSENVGRVYVKDSLPHEVAHYLGVPHTFVERWPPPEDRQAAQTFQKDEDLAMSIVSQADCGASKWLNASPIADLDYVHSQHTIGDTVPIWKGATKAGDCLTAYASRIVEQDPYRNPAANLMSYSKTRGRYLTPQQFARAVGRLTAMSGLAAPQNLCH